MDGMNKVILVGTITQDVEVRHTQSGQTVATLNVATNESFYDQKTKDTKRHTEFHKVVVWGNYAQLLGNVAGKGTHLVVEGKIRTRKYEDKTGATRYSTEIIADGNGGVKLLANFGKDRQGGEPTRNVRAPKQEQPELEYPDDQIPF